MNISQIMEKMIAFSNGNLRDMTHLMCVWTYAKTIGELEGLDRKTQETLEIAAITHDIACPLCREKYGNTNGKRQEEEGGPLVRSFLEPKVMAAQVDLPPLTALMAMYIGFCTFGVGGMIFFPLALLFLKQLHDAGYLRLWKQ